MEQYEKMKRDYEITDSLIEHQQISDEIQRTTDVNLICSDGVIPVHAALLQAVSPFFDKIFSLQRYQFLDMYTVVLPDYTISIFKKVVELIYFGDTHVLSVEDADSIKEILAYLEIKISLNQSENNDESSNSKVLLTYPFKNEADARKFFRIEVDSLPVESQTQSESRVVDKSAEVISSSKYPNENLKKAVTIDCSSNSHYDNETEAKKCRKKRMEVPSSSKSQNITQTSGSDKKPNYDKNKRVKENLVSESSEDETYGSNYTDKVWFLNESKKCQYCRAQHKTAAAASICLTGHSRLRCYYCFKVVRSTEKLFQHFREKHKQAGRENCLMCPFCKSSIPYKSVSCHVISMHLHNPNKNKYDKKPELQRTAGSAPKKRKVNKGDESYDEITIDEDKSSITTTSANELGSIKIIRKGSEGGMDQEGGKLTVLDLCWKIKRKSIWPGKIRVFRMEKIRCLPLA